MSTYDNRRRASDNPAEQQRWARVWIEADRRRPFALAHTAEHPPVRRRWWGKGL